MQVGSKVRIGKKVLSVIKIEDHKPIDGPTQKNTIVWLSDNTWYFSWNLTEIPERNTERK